MHVNNTLHAHAREQINTIQTGSSSALLYPPALHDLALVSGPLVLTGDHGVHRALRGHQRLGAPGGIQQRGADVFRGAHCLLLGGLRGEAFV